MAVSTDRSRRRSVGRSIMTIAVAAGTLFVAACGGGGSSSASGANGQKYAGNLTYWFWGESDIPGITNWMQGMITQYEKLHPKVKISLVPQSSSTLIGSFRLAA